MIGSLCIIVSPYYDRKNNRNSYKKRPALVISGPRNNDYTILPVSSVSKKENLDEVYDIKVDPEKYPLLGLNKVSYIRTHKQTVVHRSSIVEKISSIKEEYNDLYQIIISSWMDFENEVFENSMK